MDNKIYYSDIDLKFRTDEFTHDFNTFTNNKDIKQSVELLLDTCYGDRLFQPEIGSALRDCLFMPSDAISQEIIENESVKILKKYEPRINITEVTSEFDQEHEALIVTIHYYIIATQEYDEVSVKFTRIS